MHVLLYDYLLPKLAVPLLYQLLYCCCCCVTCSYATALRAIPPTEIGPLDNKTALDDATTCSNLYHFLSFIGLCVIHTVIYCMQIQRRSDSLQTMVVIANNGVHCKQWWSLQTMVVIAASQSSNGCIINYGVIFA